MAMDDADKWASQLLDELLEKLAKVDGTIVPQTEIAQDKCQNISRIRSNGITESIFQESKTARNHSSSYGFKYEKGSNIFYQPDESRNFKHEFLGESFQEKMHLEGDDSYHDLQKVRTCDKIPYENHKTLDGQTLSIQELTETVKNSNDTSNESEEKDISLNNSVLEVVEINDSRELKNNDLLADNCENILGKNLTNVVDGYCFQLRENNHIISTDEINFDGFTKSFETEDHLLQNPMRIEEKNHRIGFENQNEEDKVDTHKIVFENQNADKKYTRQHVSHIESLYEHVHKKFTEEEIDYCRSAESGNSIDFCSTEHMIRKLGTEKYKKTENDKIHIKSQGDDCSNIEMESEELDKEGDMINQVDIDNEMILLERNIRNAFENGEENYENICFDTKTEDKKNFEIKNIKNITDLVPLIKTIIFCLAMDSALDIDLKTNAKENNRIPHKPNDVLKRTDVSDDPIIAQRYFKIISVYRNACRAFEDLILNPSAIFIAVSVDILTFFFYLSVSVFYMLYKSINVKFNSFQNNKANFSDLLKRKKCKVEKISNECNILDSDFKNEIEEKNEFEEKVSMSSFSSHEEHNEILEKKDEIYVAPEKVKVAKYVSEHVTETLGDLYEKGCDYFEELSNERDTAIVKSHEDIFVDIILKGSKMQISEGHEMNDENASVCATDLDLGFIKSSNEICQSCKNNSCQFITLSNDNQEISDDISKNMPSIVNLPDHNVSDLILFDKSRANIFNSTEVENSFFETNSRRFSNTLTPSEINIFDGLCSNFLSPGSICGNGLRSSSLSVNATSFPSISSINISPKSCSPSRFSFNMEKTPPLFQDENVYSDTISMEKDLNVIRMSNKNSASSLNSQNDEILFHLEPKRLEKTTRSIQPKEPHVAEESFSIETVERLPLHISATDEDIQTSYAHGENSILYDSPESLSYSICTDNTYNEICFVDSDETAVNDTNVLKKKNIHKLRRRMSGIFNNLRGVNFMQCVMLNAKRQKRYKKQTNGSDA